jgi:hypothetical protein
MAKSDIATAHCARLFMAIALQCSLAHASELTMAASACTSSQVHAASDDDTHLVNVPPVMPPGARSLSDTVHSAPEKSKDAVPHDLPQAVRSELDGIDANRLEIETGMPIERWRFDDVRASYQDLLKTAPGDLAVEKVVRDRLELLNRRERTMKAAATIRTILAQSHNRDQDIVELRRRLRTSADNLARSRSYQAVGFMQASAQKIDGQKLFLLVGRTGETVAYLDVPPGLDPEPVLAHKVGVRGVAHYNGELQSRVITVRDFERIEPSR